MKEEDFIERLMYRFDSKRFCRDCRKNVIREFKELNELKRMRKEPRCASCFCIEDTDIQYEVSDDTVHADWHETFSDSVGSYHHFKGAIGTGEGKADVLEFENVELNGRVQVTGLDLGGLNACFITLRAWRYDGRCTEISVKAHNLNGQVCVHGRLVVGDGFVTITRGESIRRFFEFAEKAEEEEDDDSMDKDRNELDGECSRPQKHAKSRLRRLSEKDLHARMLLALKLLDERVKKSLPWKSKYILQSSLPLPLPRPPAPPLPSSYMLRSTVPVNDISRRMGRADNHKEAADDEDDEPSNPS